MADLEALLADLRAEGAAVDALVAPLPPAAWRTPTPAAGWTVAHQVAHLAWTDDAALLAATDPDAFRARRADAAADPAGFVDAGAATGAADPPDVLLARWRAGRARLADALAAVPAGGRLPWYGTAMAAGSMATARIMETWAHGRDVADALGVAVAPTARLRHVAYLGVRTRGHAHLVHGRPVPPGEVHVALTAPDGGVWTWGPADALDRVAGPALDFCLLVCRRVHRDDTALVATPGPAEEWLGIAQAFAGPPGEGRPPAGGAA